MRFKPKSKTDNKTIRKVLNRKSYTYGMVGLRKLSFKTELKKDIQYIFNDIFPQKPSVYAAISSAVIVSSLLFYICNLQTNIINLNKENQGLVEKNYSLCNSIDCMNSSIIELDSESKIQQEVINKQQKDLIEIEKSVDNISSEKDAALKELINMINNLDIFGDLVSRSENFHSATTQIYEAKEIINAALGNSEEATKLIDKLDNEQEKIDDYKKRYPDYNPVPGRLTSRYGYRRDPFTGKTAFHEGIDIGASYGTTIVSAAFGTVVYTGFNSGSGNYITIDHGNGYKTQYKHLSKILVKKGDIVNKAQKIGLVGSTGRSTGPHLHFEVIINGNTTNPLGYVYYS